MTTSLAELQRWLDTPRENEHLEFKEAKQTFDDQKLFRYCVGLANEGGGKLVLGITDQPPRRVVGTQCYSNTDSIASKIFNKVRFRVDVEEVAHPDGRVLVFHIPSRPNGTAYQFEGAYLMRSTEDLVPMSEDRLRMIFDEGKPDWLSEAAQKNCTGDDVVRLLDTQGYFDLLNLPYPANRDAVLEKFGRENLIQRDGERWTITRLGAILFAKRLGEFETVVARKAPRVIVYAGLSKLETRHDQFGTKGYAVGFELLLEFLNGLIPANEVIGQALRTETKMFPSITVRELVANALIHQDFEETGTSVVIELYSDRLVITSPGRPFISTERFIDEYQSRNERLADLMRRLHICEEKGSGVDKVIDAVEKFQLPAPDFRANERQTISLLFAHKGLRGNERRRTSPSVLSTLLLAASDEPDDDQSEPARTVWIAGSEIGERDPYHQGGHCGGENQAG